jgi:DNA repair protein RadC
MEPRHRAASESLRKTVANRGIQPSVQLTAFCTTTPSGDPTPSQADIHMTKAIVQIATPLGIAVHDHIIVGKNGHAGLEGMRLI